MGAANVAGGEILGRHYADKRKKNTCWFVQIRISSSTPTGTCENKIL